MYHSLAGWNEGPARSRWDRPEYAAERPGGQGYFLRISSISATARGSFDWLSALTASLRTTALCYVRASWMQRRHAGVAGQPADRRDDPSADGVVGIRRRSA